MSHVSNQDREDKDQLPPLISILSRPYKRVALLYVEESDKVGSLFIIDPTSNMALGPQKSIKVEQTLEATYVTVVYELDKSDIKVVKLEEKTDG